MRIKKADKNKTERFQGRCSLKNLNALQLKANLYCNGNLSEYLIYAGMNFIAGIEDMEKEKAGN